MPKGSTADCGRSRPRDTPAHLDKRSCDSLKSQKHILDTIKNSSVKLKRLYILAQLVWGSLCLSFSFFIVLEFAVGFVIAEDCEPIGL